MSDPKYRGLFRAGLAPLVEDVPEGPDWDELTGGEIVTAVPPTRRMSGWIVGLGAAVVVLVLVGVAVLLGPAAPPSTTSSAATTAPSSQDFDIDKAASEVETWWSLVAAGDLAAAADMAHPDADFNFGGLVELVSGLGSDVSVSAERDLFGTDQLRMLCYTLTGTSDEETGAAVFREHEQAWMLWEVRPSTVGCLNTASRTAPWELRSVDGARLTIVIPMIGDPTCEKFSRVEVSEDDTTVNLTALISVLDDDGCFLALLLHQETITLSQPLGNRELTGCLLGQSPNLSERQDCREIVPEQ